VDQKNDRKPTDQPISPEPQAPAPRKRFRIEKIEERIAPKKGGGQGSIDGSSYPTSSSSGSY